MNIYILKIVHAKNLIGKLLLGCEDEILSKTNTLLDDKNVACT